MSNTMIALAGGQSLPNLIPIRSLHPAQVVLVHTADRDSVTAHDRLKTILEPDPAVISLQTEAFETVAIIDSLITSLTNLNLRGDDLVFNLTGGTKPMALAAYTVAQRFGSPVLYLESGRGSSRIYRYAWQGGTLCCQDIQEVGACVTIHEFLDLHLGPGGWQERGIDPHPANQGGRFEQVLVDTLTPHFDEVIAGITTPDKSIEADILVRFGNQFGVIEAKVFRRKEVAQPERYTTTQSGERNLKPIRQLNESASLLRSIYARKFFVMGSPEKAFLNAYGNILRAMNITVIALPGFSANDGTLPPEERDRLVNSIKSAMAGHSTERR